MIVVTERKPAGVGFETWVERQIREAQERGEFDALPGAGKPLSGLDRPHDELWWVKEKLRREEGTALPPTLLLRREAEAAREAARRASSEAEVRRVVAAINARIEDAIRKPMSGPPLNLVPFDVEVVVARWRAERPA
ncbi:DUF1992 domain-containing protein [Saccharothrix sp. Mg75]|uniref:DnaJ family domain-containing protein n=1 Tax=Saccharothrix sp. Mg75 TaxID=3445357 RepID=UPI003EEA8AB6